MARSSGLWRTRVDQQNLLVSGRSYSSELQQPTRVWAVMGSHLRTPQAAPIGREQGCAVSSHPGGPAEATADRVTKRVTTPVASNGRKRTLTEGGSQLSHTAALADAAPWLRDEQAHWRNRSCPVQHRLPGGRDHLRVVGPSSAGTRCRPGALVAGQVAPQRSGSWWRT
jgi:hypothetical protein